MIKCKLCHQEFREITHTHLRYIHNVTLAEYIKKYSRASLCSDETRELIRTIGRNNPPFFLGHKHTEEWKRNQGIRTSRRNKIDNPMCKKGIARNQSLIMKRLWANPDSLYNSAEYREKHSQKLKRMWNNPEQTEAILKGRNARPNKAEISLSYILRNTSPRRFRYNGDFRLGISVGRRIPDFVNVNGRKQVIELFGAYWHEPCEEEERICHYRRYGYGCLIIWGKELKKANRKELQSKILQFVGGD